MQVKTYTSSGNGINVIAKVSGHTVTLYIQGTSAVELGTAGGYASCGSIPELVPLFSDATDVIKYAKINPVVNSQIRVDRSNGAILIGYTINNAGEAINFPSQYGVVGVETFVL